MKKTIITLVICFLQLAGYTQNSHPAQAVPFKKVLLAFKSDSVALFTGAFSKELDSVEIPLERWKERLNEGKRKFKRRYGNYELEDFTFKYIDSSGELQVFFRSKESFKIRVVKEDEEWKLIQH